LKSLGPLRFDRGKFGIVEPAQRPQRIDHILPPGQRAPPASAEIPGHERTADNERAEYGEENLKIAPTKLKPSPATVAIVPRAQRLAEYKCQHA